MSLIRPALTRGGSKPPLAIVGAGIAGLSLALALRRRAIDAILVEARTDDQIRREGAFLTLAPNGVNALRAIDLAEGIARSGIETAGIALFNERGRRIGLLDYGRHRARYGAASITIRRGVLSGALLDACRREGVELRLGHAVTSLENGEDGVMLTAGGRRERFAAVIGCDGLRSTIRKTAFPGFPQPSYSGLIGTGGLVDVPGVAPTDGMMKMTFGRRAFFGYIKAPGQPVYWFSNYPAPEAEAGPVSEPRAYARSIARLHEDDPLENAAIMDAVDAIERHYPLYDIPDLPCWWTGRVLLMGDAAHAVTPHSGQGASLAIEDAVVLAAILAEAEDLADAFRSFERSRRQRTGRALRVGRMSGSQKLARSWLALRIRDLVLPMLVPIVVRAQERLYAFRADLDPLATERQSWSS